MFLLGKPRYVSTDPQAPPAPVDLTLPIVLLGPLSWALFLPSLVTRGWTGLSLAFQAFGAVGFWHLTGPILLLGTGILRRRRGFGLGRGTRPGMAYFLVVAVWALVHHGGDILGGCLVVDFKQASLFVAAMCLLVILLLMAWAARRGFRPQDRRALIEVLAAAALAWLFTVGLLYLVKRLPWPPQ